jgi:hypothetical protein
MTNKVLIWAAGFVLLLIVGFILYTWIVLSWSYSTGERAGYVQKMSKKGWVCKTWEGEMALVTMPGTVAEKFYFTIRDEKLAERINKLVGKRLSILYEQHIGVPTSCFGDTNYFATDVKVLD